MSMWFKTFSEDKLYYLDALKNRIFALYSFILNAIVHA